MSEDKLTLKEMCAEFDVTPRTLRYYEYIELIAPEKRGRTRFYGAKEKARLTLIKRGRRIGFSLEQVRQWLELYEKDPSQHEQMEALRDLTSDQREELVTRKKEIEDAISELDNLREYANKQLSNDTK